MYQDGNNCPKMYLNSPIQTSAQYTVYLCNQPLSWASMAVLPKICPFYYCSNTVKEDASDDLKRSHLSRQHFSLLFSQFAFCCCCCSWLGEIPLEGALPEPIWAAFKGF